MSIYKIMVHIAHAQSLNMYDVLFCPSLQSQLYDGFGPAKALAILCVCKDFAFSARLCTVKHNSKLTPKV